MYQRQGYTANSRFGIKLADGLKTSKGSRKQPGDNTCYCSFNGSMDIKGHANDAWSVIAKDSIRGFMRLLLMPGKPIKGVDG